MIKATVENGIDESTRQQQPGQAKLNKHGREEVPGQ